MDPDPGGPKTCDPDPDPEHCVVQKILEFSADLDTCVKDQNLQINLVSYLSERLLYKNIFHVKIKLFMTFIWPGSGIGSAFVSLHGSGSALR